jgi:hypothetical protein
LIIFIKIIKNIAILRNKKDPKLFLKRGVLKEPRLNEPQVFLKLINDLTNDDVAKNDE